MACGCISANDTAFASNLIWGRLLFQPAVHELGVVLGQNPPRPCHRPLVPGQAAPVLDAAKA
eukprot:539159-Rhodomonas_salina.4